MEPSNADSVSRTDSNFKHRIVIA